MIVAGFGEEGMQNGEKLESPPWCLKPLTFLQVLSKGSVWRRESVQARNRALSFKWAVSSLAAYRPRPPSMGRTPKEILGFKCSIHDPIKPALHSG